MPQSRLTAVLNRKAHPNACKNYVYLGVEDFDGTPLDLVFTSREIEVANVRAQKNPEDIPAVEVAVPLPKPAPKKGFWARLFGK